jgi:hypothetical protein
MCMNIIGITFSPINPARIRADPKRGLGFNYDNGQVG